MTSFKCARCGTTETSLKMSYFNTDMLCPECVKKEEAHPDFKKAKDIELQHVLNGDYNFAGIGKPADL